MLSYRIEVSVGGKNGRVFGVFLGFFWGGFEGERWNVVMRGGGLSICLKNR